MARYIRLDVVSMVRSGYFLVFSVLFSAGFYVMFTKLFTVQGWTSASGFAATYMVSLGVSGAFYAALTGGGIRLGEERGSGWARQLTLTPLSPRRYVFGKLVAAWLLALPALAAIFLLAVLLNRVTMPPANWALTLAATWGGSLCFAVFGVAIGLLVAGEATQFACLGVFFPMAILGGLWFPTSAFPEAVRRVVEYLPTSALYRLGISAEQGSGPVAVPLLVLACWTALAGMAALARLRPESLSPAR
ncbi:ABC transporter [Sphaerisporangium krabiense]|uniref:ABC-2 type transport system permease protein n=1 Tax=Sphaerisporangium krabiense TaxID=763782 RepID=A0A7W8Z757_9ACTN|nr:ABC transporter permease [Sphaerisporangium krabiense]MBB5628728.1 ABC-2 type transport system permease protein [Sphaerisporangium krabiense]GII60433.1 ABC transporter [Sphaerisporangium krabiense]